MILPLTGSRTSSSTPIDEQYSPKQVTSNRKRHRMDGEIIDLIVERTVDKYELRPSFLERGYFEGGPSLVVMWA